MLTVIGYTKVIKSFRRKKREVFVPIYKDLGKGSPKQKLQKIELKRET